MKNSLYLSCIFSLVVISLSIGLFSVNNLRRSSVISDGDCNSTGLKMIDRYSKDYLLPNDFIISYEFSNKSDSCYYIVEVGDALSRSISYMYNTYTNQQIGSCVTKFGIPEEGNVGFCSSYDAKYKQLF